MRTSLLVVAVALACLPSPADAGIITVDCNGGAMHTDLRAAILSGGASDTVLVSPCTYFANPGAPPWVTLWPIELTSNSPTIMSTDGAASTIIEGDGTIPAFVITESARVDMHGLTFRSLTTPLGNASALSSSVFRFTGSIVEDCSAGLNASCTPNDAVVSGNIIRNNGGTGIYVYHNSGVIEYNEVYLNSGGYYSAGISGACCETPEIRHNHVHDNNSNGIKTGFTARLTGNLIENNSQAGIWLSVYNYLDRNVIRGNMIGVEINDSAVHGLLVAECNDIYGNTSYNVRVTEYAEGGNWDFRNRWWGTTDPAEIAAGIEDCNDDPGFAACILFDPWAEAPCDPTATEVTSWGALKALFRE